MQEVLERFRILDIKLVSLPVTDCNTLTKGIEDKQLVDQSLY
jgi:hypothetical protein